MWVSFWFRVIILKYIFQDWNNFCPVCWKCWIHWLHFCRGVRPPSHPLNILGITSASDGEAPVLEFKRTWSTFLLHLFPGLLWPRLVVPVQAPSMSQVELFDYLQRITLVCNVFKFKYIIADFKAIFHTKSKNHTHFFLTKSNFLRSKYYNSVYFLLN